MLRLENKHEDKQRVALPGGCAGVFVNTPTPFFVAESRGPCPSSEHVAECSPGLDQNKVSEVITCPSENKNVTQSHTI